MAALLEKMQSDSSLIAEFSTVLDSKFYHSTVDKRSQAFAKPFFSQNYLELAEFHCVDLYRCQSRNE